MLFPRRRSHSPHVAAHARVRAQVPVSQQQQQQQQRSTSATASATTYVFVTWIFLVALMMCSGIAFVWRSHRERADRESTIAQQVFLARNVVDLVNSQHIGWDQFELDADRLPSASDFSRTYDHPSAGAPLRNSRSQRMKLEGLFTSYTHHDISQITTDSVVSVRNSRHVGSRKRQIEEALLSDDLEETDLKFRQVSLDITSDMLETYADLDSPFRCLSTFEIHRRDPLVMLPTRPVSCECERPTALLTGEFTYLDPKKCSTSEVSNFMSVDQEIVDVDMSRTVNIVVTTSADHRIQLDVFLLQFEDMARDGIETNFHVTVVEFEGIVGENENREEDATDELRDLLYWDASESEGSFAIERLVLHGEFSRVLGLRRGVQSVRDRVRTAATVGGAGADPLVLVADTTVFFPEGFLDLVRMHTIAGRSVFSPICMKQFPGEGLRRNLWGYGIIAFHLSDYDNTKTYGYNIKRANAWGQEDTDFISELQAKGIKIARILVPDYEYIRVVAKDSASWYYLGMNSRDRELPVTPIYQDMLRGELEFNAVQEALEYHTGGAVDVRAMYKVHEEAQRARGYYAVIWAEEGTSGAAELVRATYVHSLLLDNSKTDGLLLKTIE